MTRPESLSPLPPLPAVILAGGLATRMGGRDKAMAPFGGQSLIAAVIARLAPQTGAAGLAINANGDPARFAATGLPVLPDPVAGFPGPLAGILAAMDWARARGYGHVLSAPTDSPFLPRDLAARLQAAIAASGARVAMAASADGTAHPVIALWPTEAASDLRAFLAKGERRVRAFAGALGMVTVPFPAADPDPFTNINHSAELDRI